MTYIQGSEEFDFNADTFDSRDVIDRINYLENIKVNHPEEWEFGGADFEEELADLLLLLEEAGEYSEFKFGQTFINSDYFQDYAEELAKDIGAIDPNASWPLNRIDWEAAADDLLIDYTEFAIRGTTFYAR